MSKKDNARLAGLIYLVCVLTGIFTLAYVPSQLIVWDNAATTYNNILASEYLFRLHIVSGIVCYLSYLLLPFILYKLFESVNRTYAVLMVVLAVFSVPVSLVNMINKVDILTLLSGAEYLNVFEPEQIHTQVMLLLESFDNGMSVLNLFWGLWLLPFGYLAFKSGYLPKIFGVLLMIGCFAYLVQFFGYFLFPNVVLPDFVYWLIAPGEIGMCLWLLIMGVKDKPVVGKS